MSHSRIPIRPTDRRAPRACREFGTTPIEKTAVNQRAAFARDPLRSECAVASAIQVAFCWYAPCTIL